MNNVAALSECFRQINSLYVMAVREVAMSDLGRACAEFGIDVETAAFFRDTSIGELHNLAQTPKALIRPALDAKSLAKVAAANASHRRPLAVLAAS